MPEGSCYKKALDLLAGRPHFRRQLADKLARRGFPEEEVAAALDRLTAEGYLDDRKTALDFTAHRLERGGEGRRRLQAELARRGAPPEAIEEAVADLSPEDDLAAAREAAELWTRRGGTDPRALARHLDRKGFSRRAIFTLLNERDEGLDESDVDP